ncbi:MAG: hypothetical protein LBL78_03310 [Prevotellaceae bacterium]|jgi:hypothetical protein|nr:hypothetical protein [Prevotellaceae bacterium]
MLAACNGSLPEGIRPYENGAGPQLLLSVLAAEGDDDNLPEEYAILNLSLFLTDAGGSIVTEKYVHTAFYNAPDAAGIRNCKSIPLPAGLISAAPKDIYVIANYDNTANLNAIATLDDLLRLTTPRLSGVNNMLLTTRGLPMFGLLTDADLSLPTVRIDLVRLCAKLDVTLTFTDPHWVGTNNRFGVDNAAAYTYFAFNNDFVIAPSDLVYYPLITMRQLDTRVFRHIAYVYESKELPFMHLYTVINGEQHDYVAKDNFPLPVRNRLYDVDIEILPPLPSATRSHSSDPTSPVITPPTITPPTIRRHVTERAW